MIRRVKKGDRFVRKEGTEKVVVVSEILGTVKYKVEGQLGVFTIGISKFLEKYKRVGEK